MVSPLKVSSGQFPFHCSLGVSTRKARLAGVPHPVVDIVAIKVKWKFQNIEFEKKGIRNQAAEQFKIERAAGQGGIWYRFRPVSVCLDKQLPRRNKYAGTC